MPMTFLEPNGWAMIVVDGRRTVARAKKWGVGYWLLELQIGEACWTDPRARMPIRDDLPVGFKDLFSRYPHMLAVKSKVEARKLMKGLADMTPFDRSLKRDVDRLALAITMRDPSGSMSGPTEPGRSVPQSAGGTDISAALEHFKHMSTSHDGKSKANMVLITDGDPEG